MNSIKTRIMKLEQTVAPFKERCLQTFSNQYGLDGEIVRDYTDEQIIKRHLKDHPEDADMKFNIIEFVVVHPKSTDGVNHVW